MIAGERHLALNSCLPADACLHHHRRVRRRLSQQRVLAAHGLQRIRGIAQLRPARLDVDQAWLPEQPRLHVADHVACGIGPRRLVGQNATRPGQSVEQLDRLDLVRVGETPSRQRKQAEQPRVP